MTLQELEKHAKSIGLFGNIGDTFRYALYMSFGEPHKSTILYYPGEKRCDRVYISKTLVWRKTKSGEIYYDSDDFPHDCKCHMMTEYYPKYKLSDDEGIMAALNNLQVQYKKCLIEIKKNNIEQDFSNDK